MRFYFILIISCFVSVQSNAYTFIPNAPYYAVMDYGSGTIILEKDSDKKIVPSSMSKLLTLYVAFGKLRSGMVKIDQLCNVSKDAFKRGGTTMFLKEGQNVVLKDLLRGIIIVSGNDASIALSECMSGSQELFVSEMNRVAKKIGLMDTNITNATGWPDPEHYMTVKDILILSKRLFDDFPEYYQMFSEPNLFYNGITQPNTNKLLSLDLGVDGLKTGKTNDGGFGVVVSAAMNERRVFAVINGLNSDKERWADARSMVAYFFHSFDTRQIFDKNEVVGEIKVGYGNKKKLKLVVAEDVKIAFNIADKDKIKVTTVYSEPIYAPIYKNQVLGDLKIEIPGQPERSVKLYASNDIEELSIFGKLLRYINSWYTD